MVGNSLIRRNLLEGKTNEIRKVIEAGEYYGMHTFDQDLLRLYSEGKIDDKAVLEEATNSEDVALRLKGLPVGGV
jgi:twitching motility protein PilU